MAQGRLGITFREYTTKERLLEDTVPLQYTLLKPPVQIILQRKGNPVPG